MLLVAAGAVGGHLWVLDSYTRTADEFADAAQSATQVRTTLAESAQDDVFTGLAAKRVSAAAAVDGVTDTAAQKEFAAAVDAQAAAVGEAQDIVAQELPDAGDQPVWTWELLAEADRLRAQAQRAADAEADAEAGLTALDGADEALADATEALVASVEPAAAALEVANVSAKTGPVLDFRDAAAAASDVRRITPAAATTFEALAHAAKLLVQSQGEELAEKAGPLQETRLEIEEYARSISGGVVLDFDWADVVAGIGGSDGIGGTATWNAARGGFSTITLSHSLAEWWPSADARALVTHEVGHAITSKCYDKFDSADQAANEEWATAWAISMGHTAEGNGVQAYGYPSQAMIDVAATCR